MNKFKVGDKVQLVVDGYMPEVPKYSVLSVVDNGVLGHYSMTCEAVEVGVANECSHEFQLVAEEAPQTSNEKPPFVSFFTSVIVAKNKDVSDIGEFLYDKNTTRISLEDEGDGVLLLVEQYYDGTIQQIRLDIEEVDTVFSAIKQLVNQLEVK